MQRLHIRKVNKRALVIEREKADTKYYPRPTTKKEKMTETKGWTGKKDFFQAQLKVALVLAVARIGDRWEPSYPRNDNHNMTLFWAFHAILLILAVATWTHVPPRDPSSDRVTLLSRPQTEEWKGWMQFAFIMYHYYRAWSAYNWIRVFVSSYVWMTGFGNFLYFDKKRDFSIERIVSMFLRINYFPLLLSWVTGVSLDLYYVVPLHTVGFFMTLITCRLAFFLQERYEVEYNKSRIAAIAICLLVHVLFYETKAVNFLLFFSKEIHVRFQIDKYSAWIGIVFGYAMKRISVYMSWAYGREFRPVLAWGQRLGGVGMIALWYFSFGYISDKFTYNPIHPFIFIFPLTGWLMIRNSSKYLCNSHSTFLEFLGRNTLETYVLQFHLFMNHQVQRIPIVVPNSGPDGHIALQICNMLLCGSIFVAFAVWARRITVATQTSVVELTTLLKNALLSSGKQFSGKQLDDSKLDEEEAKPMIEEEKERVHTAVQVI